MPAMIGTIFSVTRAMDLMPPTMTAPTSTAKTIPTTQVFCPRKPSSPPLTLTIWAVAWLDWNMLPPPTEPPIMHTAKTAARTLPSVGQPRSAKPSRR